LGAHGVLRVSMGCFVSLSKKISIMCTYIMIIIY
jgi:hypothetical protein